MEASNAQDLRTTGTSRLNAVRTHLMDLELWGLLLIGTGLFLFA